MPRDPRHDVLFETVRIGPKVLRNRFYQTPHCTGFGVEKPWSQAAFRGMKAEGGWAAVNTEYCAVSPDSDDKPFVSARLWDDEDARALSLMVEEAHRHGALAGVQLWHGGINAENRESRLPLVAPSAAQSSLEGTSVARAMTLHDIRRIQHDWVAAARRARDAGFDIVYVYGSHNYLPTQFLSSRFNRRADAYGGSFENRARFWLEAIERVREAIGDACAIAVRIAADDLEHSGVEPDEGAAFIRAADHLVDLWDLSVGGVYGRRPARLRLVSLRGRGLPAAVDRPRPRRDGEAGRRRRALHRPDRDGGDRARRTARPDRRRTPLHRRPVPAPEDRGGPLRRDPRVHRLQRLLLACRVRHAPRLYAERHRGRGAPPRMASRAIPAGQRARPDRARRRRRAGRARVRDRPRQARRSTTCTSSTRRPRSAGTCAG